MPVDASSPVPGPGDAAQADASMDLIAHIMNRERYELASSRYLSYGLGTFNICWADYVWVRERLNDTQGESMLGQAAAAISDRGWTVRREGLWDRAQFVAQQADVIVYGQAGDLHDEPGESPDLSFEIFRDGCAEFEPMDPTIVLSE